MVLASCDDRALESLLQARERAGTGSKGELAAAKQPCHADLTQ